jgi:hypothetical protein
MNTKEYKHEYYLKNKEKLLSQKKENRRIKKYKNNPEKQKIYFANFLERNPNYYKLELRKKREFKKMLEAAKNSHRIVNNQFLSDNVTKTSEINI